MHEYQVERKVVEKGIEDTTAEIAADPKVKAKQFGDLLTNYKPIHDLTREIMLKLIERIVVHESEFPRARADRSQLIEIYYKHIGRIGKAIRVGAAVENVG